ncbi:hypothetical protein AUC71_10030 [Methyloceanibacter marginalis]|uniref:Uncharacterized protein n=1 Tax=Methyloceanibacter marginalis TaxID=1774971 RepID=A0A1E3WC19_9HYPH|nr:hypothetical protein [Methyloceanibacter marginalis]ODS03363.1 hypothetical protein AUC71_10030 [Methyloceanibacter marginalis]
MREKTAMEIVEQAFAIRRVDQALLGQQATQAELSPRRLHIAKRLLSRVLDHLVGEVAPQKFDRRPRVEIGRDADARGRGHDRRE